MKKTDKFFIGIVGGVVLLIVISLVFVLKPSMNDYLPEDNPEGVMLNYLLSLRERDYKRAYGYLSPDLLGYPKSIQSFRTDILDNIKEFDDLPYVTLSIDSIDIKGKQATVIVQEIRFFRGDIFSSGQRISTIEYDFAMDDGEWKIYSSSSTWYADEYFLGCWTVIEGCEK